jgi:hypothetical protein
MELLNLLSQNLLTPAILFFALGVSAGFLKSLKVGLRLRHLLHFPMRCC